MALPEVVGLLLPRVLPFKFDKGLAVFDFVVVEVLSRFLPALDVFAASGTDVAKRRWRGT